MENLKTIDDILHSDEIKDEDKILIVNCHKRIREYYIINDKLPSWGKVILTIGGVEHVCQIKLNKQLVWFF